MYTSFELVYNSSEKRSVLLIAGFLGSYGNDNPYRMDYKRCKHPFSILYPIAPKSVWGYLSTIGSTYLTLVLLPTGTIYRGTQPNTIQLKKYSVAYSTTDG